jgi:hypothetical protein
MRSYWIKALFVNKEDIIEGEIDSDGLLVRAAYQDIKHLLSNRPSGSRGWYFNKTKDRLIAEPEYTDLEGTEFTLVTANPQLLTQAGYKIKVCWNDCCDYRKWFY